MQLKGGKPAKGKRRFPKPSVLLIFGVPVLLVCAYLIEGLGNPKLFSSNYLKAEYGPILLWPWERGHAAFDNGPGLLSASLRAAPNLIASASSGENIPDLVLDVKFRDMRAIYEQRDEALIRGRIVQNEDSFVKAKIRGRDKTTPVKIRLKGDFTDHVRGEKWSFRVHVRKGETYLGMRYFSVQNPAVRGYHAENLYFHVLRDYGVLTPRYQYVNMMLNGNDLGIMALEEHFSKELLEAQSRREGVIVRYDENRVFSSADGPRGNGFGGIYDDFRNAATDVFQGSKLIESPTLYGQSQIASGMLRAFSEGRVSASEIFDADTMGAYLAVSELMGAFHAIRWHNQRFYMNPITLKMEPIAYDASLKQRESGDEYISAKEAMVQQMLQDPKIFARYKEVLSDLVARVETGELIDSMREEERRLLDILHAEYFFLPKYPLDEVERRAAFLGALNDTELRAANFSVGQPQGISSYYRNALRAYRVTQGERGYLDLASAIPYPVTIDAIEVNGQRIILPGLPMELQGRAINDVSPVTRIELPADLAEETILVVGRQQGYSFNIKAVKQAPLVNRNPIPVSDIDELLAQSGFLSVDEPAKQVSIAPGEWPVTGIMALPEGYSLQAGPGTTLRFAEDAALIVRGNVFFEGTTAEPVQLLAQEGAESWLGFVAFAAPERSRWSNVVVRDTRGLQLGVWKLMGGTNFYRNSVDMSDISILHHKGEDGLNIISSDFAISNLQIIDTLSDGFDCDFCTGEIMGGLFEDIGTAGGGDAVDVSTSNISLNGTRFLNVDDKALSVGEASQVQAENLIIDACGTGAAAKDGSRLDIANSSISNSRISALMAYIKKPEFGIAEVVARNMVMEGNRAVAVVQTGSRVSLDGEEFAPEDIDVDELYETVMRPGLRRPKAEARE